MPQRILALIILLCGALQTPSGVTVGGEGEFPTLRAALLAPFEGQLILELLDPVYTEPGLTIDRDVIFLGRGAGRTVIQGAESPGEAPDRVIKITIRGKAVFKELTIRHGRPRAVPFRGGGIDNEGFLRMENCVLADNEAVYGGGLFTRGRAELVGCEIRGNHTTDVPLELQNTGIGCRGSGAGIKTEKGGDLFLENCTVYGNRAFKRGGGLFVACESRAVVRNSTIAENQCRRRGGGIYNKGDLILIHATVAGNESIQRGSGVCTMGKVSLLGTLIADNSYGDFVVADGGGIYGAGFVEENRGNFVGDGSLEGALSGDPLLKPLRSRGGLPPVMALRMRSPARNGVSSDFTPSADQRGVVRDDHPDIGAFEFRFLSRRIRDS